MKKIFAFIMFASLSLTAVPNRMLAATATEAATTTGALSADAIKGNALMGRLNEIKVMDKSNLSNSERRTLRKEVRSIGQQLSGPSGGVYISVGAIILIIILVLILL